MVGGNCKIGDISRCGFSPTTQQTKVLTKLEKVLMRMEIRKQLPDH